VSQTTGVKLTWTDAILFAAWHLIAHASLATTTGFLVRYHYRNSGKPVNGGPKFSYHVYP